MSGAARIDEARDRLIEDGVILCVRFGAEEPILEACRAAARGGLTVLEITLTTPGALDAIAALSAEEGLLVGAGTALSFEDVRAVAGAGGRFVLSPVFDSDVVDEAHRLGLLAVPGGGTAKEILAAHRGGARLVKVFPAGALGGPDFLRTLRGPLPDIALVPTSGPTSGNAAEYFDAGAVAIGIGAEVFPPRFDLAGVERAARRVRAAVDEARAQ